MISTITFSASDEAFRIIRSSVSMLRGLNCIWTGSGDSRALQVEVFPPRGVTRIDDVELTISLGGGENITREND